MASRTHARDTKTRSGTVHTTPPPSRKRGPSNAGEQQNKHQKKRQGAPEDLQEVEEPTGVKKRVNKAVKKPRLKKQWYAPSPPPLPY